MEAAESAKGCIDGITWTRKNNTLAGQLYIVLILKAIHLLIPLIDLQHWFVGY